MGWYSAGGDPISCGGMGGSIGVDVGGYPHGELGVDVGGYPHADPCGDPQRDPQADPHADPHGHPHGELGGNPHGDPHGFGVAISVCHPGPIQAGSLTGGVGERCIGCVRVSWWRRGIGGVVDDFGAR